MLQLDLLHSSFEQVRGQKEDFAAAFYKRLFTKFPQTQPLFALTDMKRQQNVLMAALGMVINALRNGEQEQLASVLRELGQRHSAYGVNPEHYQMVAVALLETFADFFGSAWTRELQDAWTEAYGAIVSLMLPSSIPQHPPRKPAHGILYSCCYYPLQQNLVLWMALMALQANFLLRQCLFYCNKGWKYVSTRL